MKTFLLSLATVLFLSGCTDSNQLEKRRRATYISTVHIPKNTTINQNVGIELTAAGTSSCWGDLKVTMTKISDKHFLFKATGLVENGGACAAVMVYKDTVINFRPESTGKYFFQTNESPFTIMYDTLEVN